MFVVDPDLVEAVVALAGAESMPTIEAAARGDWQALRKNGEAGLIALASLLPERAEITRTEESFLSFDGAEIQARWYRGRGDAVMGAPAVLYIHGGGMIMRSVALYDRMIARYVADSGVSMLAVEYRVAPEHPHPTPVEDCVAGLTWLRSTAADLGIDAERISIMGDSGGGGLAAATALLARDRDIAVARQILLYPMLDDRNTEADPLLAPFAAWSYDDNYTGWHALLGDAIGSPDVSPYGAPARATDLHGLPDAYIEVGELDIFRDECIDYAQRLLRAGTSVELHVHRGCTHGFDLLGDTVGVARRAWADRVRTLQGL